MKTVVDQVNSTNVMLNNRNIFMADYLARKMDASTVQYIENTIVLICNTMYDGKIQLHRFFSKVFDSECQRTQCDSVRPPV